MLSAWLLPEHIADVLPAQARRIEELRRSLLDKARSYGFELVMPPLLEYLESLLSGTGRALDLQTFKLVDQLSGRTLGLRADTTPQVARIDAHLLNRTGVTRLCYCGPVLHTRPDRPFATREPLQFGAEIYGHAGLESDLEVIELALTSLDAVSLKQVSLDLSDARIVPALLAGASISADTREQLHQALASKDLTGIQALAKGLPANIQNALIELVQMYGDVSVLSRAEKTFAASHTLSIYVFVISVDIFVLRSCFRNSFRHCRHFPRISLVPCFQPISHSFAFACVRRVVRDTLR